MFNHFFESLYNKVLVNIVVKNELTNVYIEIYAKSSLIKQIEKNFETLTLNSDMQMFINRYTKESPYFYIALLDYGVEQGAIETCVKSKLSDYCDIDAMKYKCQDNIWMYFTSKIGLYEIEKKYHNIGIDYIFSPFSLLTHFFQDKITTNMAMYILVQDTSLSLGIFDKGDLLYAEHLNMKLLAEDDEDMLINDIDLESDAIDIEDVDAINEIDNLEDFGDIEDLDALEEIDEFSENKDIEEEFSEDGAESKEASRESGTFNEDYQRFSFIQKSLGHYYNDAKYESQFIENVYIADGVGVSGDLKHYLEEEMFLNVYIRRANISMELCELTKMELGL